MQTPHILSLWARSLWATALFAILCACSSAGVSARQQVAPTATKSPFENDRSSPFAMFLTLRIKEGRLFGHVCAVPIIASAEALNPLEKSRNDLVPDVFDIRAIRAELSLAAYLGPAVSIEPSQSGHDTTDRLPVGKRVDAPRPVIPGLVCEDYDISRGYDLASLKDGGYEIHYESSVYDRSHDMSYRSNSPRQWFVIQDGKVVRVEKSLD